MSRRHRYMRCAGRAGTFGSTDAEIAAELDQWDQVDREATKDGRRSDREQDVSVQREMAHQRLEAARDAGHSDEEHVALAAFFDDQETQLRRRADQRWRETCVKMNPGAAD